MNKIFPQSLSLTPLSVPSSNRPPSVLLNPWDNSVHLGLTKIWALSEALTKHVSGCQEATHEKYLRMILSQPFEVEKDFVLLLPWYLMPSRR